LLPYGDLILSVAPKVLITVKENFHVGVMRFLKLVIKSMTGVFIEDFYISPDGRDKLLSEFLPIRVRWFNFISSENTLDKINR